MTISLELFSILCGKTQYEERTAKLRANVPQLEAIVAKQWGKEEELKGLKSALAALGHKITAAFAPIHEDTTDGEDIKSAAPQQEPANIKHPQSSKKQEDKSSLVADQQPQYKSVYPLRSTFLSTGL